MVHESSVLLELNLVEMSMVIAGTGITYISDYKPILVNVDLSEVELMECRLMAVHHVIFNFQT